MQNKDEACTVTENYKIHSGYQLRQSRTAIQRLESYSMTIAGRPERTLLEQK